MRNAFFLIVTLLISLNTISQNVIEKGNPYIQNYNGKDYNTIDDQTWAIVEDKRGVMYFGTNAGVMEFDANSWRLIEMPNKSDVRSLAIDNNSGRIYVGAIGEFGYLQADSTGSMQYVSLLDKIPEEYKSFDDVWETFVIDEQVIFRAYSYIFMLKENKLKTIAGAFNFGFSVNNRFYMRQFGKGLRTLNGDSLKFIENSEQLAHLPVFIMLPYEEDKILMVSRTFGVFIYSLSMGGTNRIEKLLNVQELDSFVINTKVYCGAKFDEEHFILGSLDGLVKFDKSGKIIQRIKKKNGLLGNNVRSIYIDSKKNIWAGLDNGISYIIDNSPLTLYNERNGLIGAAQTSKVYKNQLYVGTSQGLFLKDLQDNFTMVENTNGACWSLQEIHGKLLLSHSNGLYTIENNTAKNIFLGDLFFSFNLFHSENYALAGHRYGVYLYEYYNKNWRLKHKIKNFKEKGRYTQIENENTIWVGHANKGIFRLKLNELLDSVVELNFFDSTQGLPANTHNYIFEIKNDHQNSQMIFGTENGIYGYNPKTNDFDPINKFNKLLNNDGFINVFAQDKKGNIYFQQGNEKGVLQVQNDGTYKLEHIPFLKFKGLLVEEISFIDSAKIFFSSKEGVIQYDSQIKPNYKVPYTTIIRQVLANDSLVYGGSENAMIPIELSYKYNNLQFIFSALFFEDHDKTQYSYILEGSSNEWSEWSLKSEKEYTHLPEGDYTFKVKARNIFENKSTVAEYQFSIQAPWYRTYWAYFGYFIVAILLIYALIWLNSRRLIKEKKKLEEIVINRTSEILQQKEEILTQAEELKTTNDNLLELNEFKQGLTSMIVHDLKNPLNLIINIPKSANYEKQIDIMQQTGKQMLNMVLNILDVDKYQDIKMTLDIEDKQFALTAKNAVKRIQFLSEQKNILIKNQIDQNIVTKVEEGIAERILVNLLTNAIKYTPLNGTITLSSKPKSETFVQIEVTDTGEGIPKEKLHLVFQKFGQIVAKKSGGVRSTGLGLTFCKLAVEAHGGEIGVISEIGKGTTFWFTLKTGTSDNIVTEIIEREIEIKNEHILFTEEEKEILRPFINRLNEFSIYETGDVEEIIEELKPNKAENLQIWLELIDACLVSLNESKYQKLLKII